jgi:hypothetical protein
MQILHEYYCETCDEIFIDDGDYAETMEHGICGTKNCERQGAWINYDPRLDSTGHGA